METEERIKAVLETAYRKRDELRQQYLDRSLTVKSAAAIAAQEAVCMTLNAVLHGFEE